MKTFLNARRFGLTLLLATTGLLTATAQQTNAPDNEVRVKITERSGDEVREIDRTYRNLPAGEQDKLVERLIDSLKTAHKDGKKRQLSVTVEDNQGNRTRLERRTNRNDYAGPNPNGEPGFPDTPRPPKPPKAPKTTDRYWKDNEMNDRYWDKNDRNTWQYDFRVQADSLSDRINRVFTPGWDRKLFVEPFENWADDFSRNTKPASIRGLQAYPNNPDRDQLNIRFTAPAKGDVSIRVTTPGGKELARKDVKDFSGEFVGQLDLGKKMSGTYFLTVTQNEDGAVKRVVVE